MLDLQNQSKSAPAIRLESIAGDLPVEIANFDGGIVTLGREPENSIVVDSVSVSRRHGCIAQAGSQWIYRDLDSTNGSWVNGVQVFPGQVRLLRHGDVIQFADFPVRVSLSDTSDTAEESRSLLVFFGDRFEAEVFLGEAQARFVIGGPDASMHVDGESPDDVQLEVINIGNRLELCTGNCSNPIIVNGLAVGGTTALVDRDEIGISTYQLIINDATSSQEVPDETRRGGAGSSPKAVREADFYQRGNVPNHLRDGEDWSSESEKRRSLSSRKFVFGQTPEEEEATGTLSLPTGEFTQRVGFETNVSQRFSTALDAEDRARAGLSERVVVFLGILVFIAIIGFVGFLLL